MFRVSQRWNRLLRSHAITSTIWLEYRLCQSVKFNDRKQSFAFLSNIFSSVINKEIGQIKRLILSDYRLLYCNSEPCDGEHVLHHPDDQITGRSSVVAFIMAVLSFLLNEGKPATADECICEGKGHLQV